MNCFAPGLKTSANSTPSSASWTEKIAIALGVLAVAALVHQFSTSSTNVIGVSAITLKAKVNPGLKHRVMYASSI